MILRINGQVQDTKTVSGGYITLDRTWQNGDTIEYTLPMALHLHRAADDSSFVALMYGPLVLAGDLGNDGVPANDQVSKNNEFFKTPDPPVPPLTGDSESLDSWIKPESGTPLTFQIVEDGLAAPIKLKPLNEIHHDRYTVYWKFSDTVSTTATP